MVRKSLCVFVLAASVLSGCSKSSAVEEEATVQEVEVHPLHEQNDSVVFDNKKIMAVTPVCALEVNGEQLDVFPYFNNDAHITVRKVLVSDNEFWKQVISAYKKTDNYRAGNGYEYVSYEGTTIGYAPIDDDEAYVAETNSLPSSYLDLVLSELCNTDT